MEQHYSGIPNVTLNIARVLLRDNNSVFFLDDMVICHDTIRELTALRKPWPLYHALTRIDKCKSIYEVVGNAMGVKTVAIFPNILTREIFDYKVLIVHDLSYLLESTTHHVDTIRYHSKAIYRDAITADLFVCVSQATAEDVVTYLNVNQSKVMANVIGVSHGDLLDPPSNTIYPCRPFALYIGTIEPRKNIELIFQALALKPNLLELVDLVICGRDGWLLDLKSLVSKYYLDEWQRTGRITRFKYITEFQKSALLSLCKYLIYPSLFEGYGLPVAEALALGTPVITTYSSSLPEAAQSSPLATLVNPDSPKELLDAMLALAKNNQHSCAVGSEFSWSEYVMRIQARVAEDMSYV